MSVPKQSTSRRGVLAASVVVLVLLLAAALTVGCRRFDLSTVLDGESGLPLTISPSTTTVEAAATRAFSAEGGIPPYIYSVVGDGTITSSGQYTAPLAQGTDIVRVTDATGKVDEARVEITTFTGGLVIIPGSLSVMVNGSATFTAIGGSGTYTFSVTDDQSGGAVINNIGYYVAGGTPGTDTVQVSDGVSTAPALVTVSAVGTNVDYAVASTSFVASETAGAAIPAGEEFMVENIGSAAGSATISWKLYLSSDDQLGGGDVVVASGTTAALGAAPASKAVTVTGTYPNVTGSYYLIVELSAADDMSPGNNVSAASAFTLNPRNVDYDVLSVSHISGTTAGEAVSGEFEYQNVGTYGGFYTVYYEAYASTDATLDAGDTLISTGSVASLAAGASGSKSFTGVWPTTPASYYLIVKLSAQDDVAAGNDVQASGSSVAVSGTAPGDVDYIVDSVTNTGGTTRGQALSGEFLYTNQGADNGSETVYYNVYVSTDAVLNVGTDPMVDSGTVAALNGGTSAPVPTVFGGTWPSSSGTYYLIVRVSSSDDVSTSNNSKASSGIAVSAPNIDYSVTSVSNVGATATGGAIDGEFTVQNVGGANGASTAYWSAYLSTNTTLEIGTDPVLDSGTLGTLGAGATTGPVSFSGTWPSGAGTYYLIVRVTADDDVNNSNNTAASAAVTTTAPQIDYFPAGITNTGGATAGGTLDGEFAIQRNAGDPATATVHWRVYLSTNTTLEIGTDQIIDSGNIAALSPGGVHGPIGFGGTWPSMPGTYYYIVSVDAGDDINPANDVLAGSGITVTAPDVDYVVSSVTNLGGTTTGGAISGEFQIQNSGLDPGGYMVYWTAYVSSDSNYDAGDTVIDTGSFSPLGAGFGMSVGFGGTWPGTAGDWYLIVRAEAWDDVDSTSNTKASAAVTVTSPAAYPDYTITALTTERSGTPGALFSAAGPHSFRIDETAGNPGSQPIQWRVYVSADQILDLADDPPVASGTLPALGAWGFTDPPISFDATWSASGFYYLIVSISAADDLEPVGNMAVSPEVEVLVYYTEGTENNDGTGPKNGTISNVGDYGITLMADELLAIQGTIDAVAGKYDTFVFTAGADCARMEIRASWSTGGDDIDLWVWDESNGEWGSQSYEPDAEPGGTLPFAVPKTFTPGARYYVGVRFMSSANAGAPYTLYIQGKP